MNNLRIAGRICRRVIALFASTILQIWRSCSSFISFPLPPLRGCRTILDREFKGQNFTGQNQCWQHNGPDNVSCAGYSNERPTEEYRLSVAKTEDKTGTRPFQDKKMMDERLSYSHDNTCVMDSLLMLLRTASDKSLNIKLLIESESLFKPIMESLRKNNIYNAQMLWLNGLSTSNPPYEVDHKNKKIDCWSRVKDHFTMIDRLAYAKAQYKHELQDHEVYKTTLMKFHIYGDVKLLGNTSYPDLIFIHRDFQDVRYNDCLETKLPNTIKDEKERSFEIQSFLLGKNSHMQTMNRESGGKWQLYDTYKKINQNPTYTDILKDLNRFIYLACYIMECSTVTCDLSVPETGKGTGPTPYQIKQHKCPCVMDSFLMLLLTVSDNSLKMKSLLDSDISLQPIMNYLRENNFKEAQRLWQRELSFYDGHSSSFEEKEINCWSKVKKHFPIINWLVAVEVLYNHEPQNGYEVYDTALEKFHKYGDVKILGNPSDPDLILIHRDLQADWYPDCLKTELPDTIMDKKNRIFKFQSFLFKKDEHMQMMNRESGGKWQLYDTFKKGQNPTYTDILKELNEYIYLACYIMECPAVTCSMSVSETGEGTGPKAFAELKFASMPLNRNADART